MLSGPRVMADWSKGRIIYLFSTPLFASYTIVARASGLGHRSSSRCLPWSLYKFTSKRRDESRRGTLRACATMRDRVVARKRMRTEKGLLGFSAPDGRGAWELHR